MSSNHESPASHSDVPGSPGRRQFFETTRNLLGGVALSLLWVPDSADAVDRKKLYAPLFQRKGLILTDIGVIDKKDIGGGDPQDGENTYVYFKFAEYGEEQAAEILEHVVLSERDPNVIVNKVMKILDRMQRIDGPQD